MLIQALSPDDFATLESALLTYGDDHSVLNVAELDGFFTALVSGPVPVDIAQWFPAIWGGEVPQWETPEALKQFIDLCVRHMNSIAAALSARTFKARFEETEHQGQALPLAEEWSFGYLRGVAEGQWPEMPATQNDFLQTITWRAEQDNFELPADLDATLHRLQVLRIEPAAQALHDYWLGQR